MLYRREGFPDEGEVVMCKVSKVYPGSVFVYLEEFSQTGMINISEVSAGRIRNMRDFVSEGKIIFCKVLRVDAVKSHIELSLRRVSESMRRKKSEALKKELVAEKIIEFVAKKHNLKTLDLYKKIAKPILEDYLFLHEFFEEVSKNEDSLNEYNVDKKFVKDIEELIRQRMKQSKIKISGKILMSFYSPNGIELIKEAFNILLENKAIIARYSGGGKYNVEIEDIDYKNAEKELKEKIDSVSEFVKSKGGLFSFEKIDSK